MMVSLPVNELFETIQGEGSYTGTPAVFIRLQGCPVGCPWCDTKHTWTLDPGHVISRPEIEAKTADSARYALYSTGDLVAAVAGFRSRHVVLTGGEPCLYNLGDLTAALLDSGRRVQIETSGTHEVRAAPGTWVTVSPKWQMPGGYAVRDDALARADELKCVVGSPSDIERVAQLRVKAPIWLQPLSVSPKATKLCIVAAIEHGWNLSLQSHKFAGVR